MKIKTDNELFHFPDMGEHRERVLKIVNQWTPPLFLAERKTMQDRFDDMARALGSHWPEWAIAYSFKTNYQVAESRVLQIMGAGAEVVSGHEYRLAKSLGYTGPDIIFNGPYKTDDDLFTAIADGAIINISSLEELQRIEDIARASKTRIPVGIRVNVPLSGCSPSHFGFSVSDGEAAIAAKRLWLSPHLRLAGLHLHLRGDVGDPALYGEGCGVLIEFLKSWSDEDIASLEYLDMGGGFAAHMTEPDVRGVWNPDPPPIDDFIAAISQPLKEFFTDRPTPRLILEPGRYLVNDAIVFISRIISVKDRSGRQEITCNGATTMLSVFRHREPMARVFRPDMSPRNDQAITSIIYGASCREDDVLFQGEISRVEVGDFVVHYSVGAYNSSFDPAFIFPSPIMKFLDDDPAAGTVSA